MELHWLDIARELQSIAQAGLTFSKDKYDLDRYEQIRKIAVKIVHDHTEISSEKITGLFASETGYQTPKVDVRSVIIKDNSILLVREKIDGCWSLPGGWADVNMSVRESAIKECFEEAGAKVEPRRIIAIQLANKHNDPLLPYTTYKIFVECDLISMNFTENTETYGSDFFSPENLPELSTGRTTERQIKMCFDAHAHKLFEPIFD